MSSSSLFYGKSGSIRFNDGVEREAVTIVRAEENNEIFPTAFIFVKGTFNNHVFSLVPK
jgi:hypothetical protein